MRSARTAAREESSSVGDLDAGAELADAEPESPGPAFDPENPLACAEASTLPPGVDTSVPTVGGYGVDAPNAELKALAAGMVGAWVGTQTRPWEPVRLVVIELHADGSYSASCEGGRLTFEQRHFAGHGPIIFELERLRPIGIMNH